MSRLIAVDLGGGRSVEVVYTVARDNELPWYVRDPDGPVPVADELIINRAVADDFAARRQEWRGEKNKRKWDRLGGIEQFVVREDGDDR